MTALEVKIVWRRRPVVLAVVVLATSPELVRRALCKTLVEEAMPEDSGVANEEPRELSAVLRLVEGLATWENCSNRGRKMARNKHRVKRNATEVKMSGK
jgi:hypothetical protein